MHEPPVSIVIVNWNGKDILRECLKSIEDLTYTNFEVIVVDNASSDGSADMVRREFSDARIVINNSNLGWVGGCNVGIELGKGEMIALLNNDIVVDSSWLTQLVAFISCSCQIAIVGGPILYDTSSTSSTSRTDVVAAAGMRIDAVTGISWCVEKGKRLDKLGDIDDLDYIPIGASLIRREALKEIGLLDPGYFLGWDDLDWCLRASRKGHKCMVSRSGIVWHKGSYTRKKSPLESSYLRDKAFFRCCLKNFPLKYILSTLFFQLLVFPFFEVFLFRRSVLFVVQRMKSFVWNLSRLREILIERRTVSLLGMAVVKNRFREFLTVALALKVSGDLPSI